MGCFSLQQTDIHPSSVREPIGTPPKPLHVIGAGPAGCAASISAALHDAPVQLHEKSRLPRHKVCGEFLSPGIAPLLETLGVWDVVEKAGVAQINRMLLRFSRTERRAILPETAYGLSRFTLDAILLNRAVELGVRVSRQAATPAAHPVIIASGRSGAPQKASRGHRLFGFKAHFEGPQDDAVGLYFGDGLYVGVSSVEGGRTNVCCLAAESILARHAFDYDSVCDTVPGIRERLGPLSRCMEWLTVGPVVYASNLRLASEPGVYLAGDALAFVDPFTGSGITNAVFSGALAGSAAATGVLNTSYAESCRKVMERSLRISAVVRRVLESGLAGALSKVFPPSAIFKATRPALAGTRSEE